MTFDQLYKKIINENSFYYITNCVNYENDFCDGDSMQAVSEMQYILREENVIRIPIDILENISKTSVDKILKTKHTDIEIYYIIDSDYDINLCIYGINKKGHDIHYFYNMEINNIDKEQILSLRGKYANGDAIDNSDS